MNETEIVKPTLTPMKGRPVVRPTGVGAMPEPVPPPGWAYTPDRQYKNLRLFMWLGWACAALALAVAVLCTVRGFWLNAGTCAIVAASFALNGASNYYNAMTRVNQARLDYIRKGQAHG